MQDEIINTMKQILFPDTLNASGFQNLIRLRRWNRCTPLFKETEKCPKSSGPHPLPCAKMASSLHPLATHQPQCWAAGWHWRAGAPAQGAAVRQSYLGKPRTEAAGGGGGCVGKTRKKEKRDERNFLVLSHSLPRLSRFTIPSGRANGRWEEPSSLLLHYTRLPSCLGSRHRSADTGEAPPSASQPRGISPAGEGQHAPDRAGNQAYFPRSFTISKKQPGREGNISRREPASTAVSVRAAPAGWPGRG